MSSYNSAISWLVSFWAAWVSLVSITAFSVSVIWGVSCRLFRRGWYFASLFLPYVTSPSLTCLLSFKCTVRDVSFARRPQLFFLSFFIFFEWRRLNCGEKCQIFLSLNFSKNLRPILKVININRQSHGKSYTICEVYSLFETL